MIHGSEVISETPVCNWRGKGGLGLAELEELGEARGKALSVSSTWQFRSCDEIMLVLKVFGLVILKSDQLSLVPNDLLYLISYFGPLDPNQGKKHLFSTCSMEGTLLGPGDASNGLKLIGPNLPSACSLLGEEDSFQDCELPCETFFGHWWGRRAS